MKKQIQIFKALTPWYLIGAMSFVLFFLVLSGCSEGNTVSSFQTGRISAERFQGVAKGNAGLTYEWNGNVCSITHNMNTLDYTVVVQTNGHKTTSIVAKGPNSFQVRIEGYSVQPFELIMIADDF